MYYYLTTVREGHINIHPLHAAQIGQEKICLVCQCRVFFLQNLFYNYINTGTGEYQNIGTFVVYNFFLGVKVIFVILGNHLESNIKVFTIT